MANSLQIQFEKVVDWFAMQLGDEEKKRLVTIYHLPRKYYEEYPIIVFQGLKMTGVFGFENPEGLLDIADLLDRKDLFESTKPRLQELKKQKCLRKTSTVVDLNMLYSAVDIGPAFEITMKQIEVAQASSELLQRILKYRFREEPEKKNVLCDRLKEVIKRLNGASDLLTLMGEDAVGSVSQHTYRKDTRTECTSILNEGGNKQYGRKQHLLSVESIIDQSHIYEKVCCSEFQLQKDCTTMTIPRVMIDRTGPPRPPPKPKQTQSFKHQHHHQQQQQQQQQQQHQHVKLDTEGYALPMTSNALPVAKLIMEDSGSGDSGIGDWPILKGQQREQQQQQQREYQKLMPDKDKTPPNELFRYIPPTTLPKPPKLNCIKK